LQELFGAITSGIKTRFPGKYFTGDGALRDEVGYYRITGRVDDVVSGHNLGTAPIEDAIMNIQLLPSSLL
jgi:acetyl-CoA synthetase